MATFTAVGPALDLDGPLPVAPLHALLETEVRKPDGTYESVVKERDATRVLNGVNVYSYPTGCALTWEPCSDGTFRVKDDSSDWPLPRFDSFVAYKAIQCSSLSIGDPEEFANRATKVLNAVLSGAVEEAISQGVAGSSNPFFGDSDVTKPAGNTAVSAGVALSYLEDAIADTCRQGMIHATPGVIAALQAFPIGREDNPRLETANGTPVVSGDGYRGARPSGAPGVTATQDWVFATGPVEVYLGPVAMTRVADSIETASNVVTFRAEQYVVALWDTALQAAVLVDWST